MRFVVERIEHLDELGVVRIALNLEHAFKACLVVVGIIGKLNGVLVAMEIKAVHLVQVPALIQAMCLKRRLVELLHLRKQAVVLKGVVGLFGLVAHPQMHKLRTQAHHLGNPTDKVVGHLVAKTHTLAHVLVERNRTLLAPGTFSFFELHLVILLRITARRLAAHLHSGIGRLLAIANLAGHRAVFVAWLQQAHNLIARHAHVGIVIHRVRIDLRPAVVGVLGAVAARDRQVHGHNPRVVVDLVQLVLIAQVLGTVRGLGLFNLVLLFDLVGRGFVLRRAARKQQRAGSRLKQATTRHQLIDHQNLPNVFGTGEPPYVQTHCAAHRPRACPRSIAQHGRAPGQVR